MFERFEAQARQAVETAVREARDLRASQIGCEHLLIGLARGRSGPAAQALHAAGLDPARIRNLAPGQTEAQPLDAGSLALIGIDLDEVRRAAEAAFGPGALDQPRLPSAARPRRARMSGDCRKAIELGLRQAKLAHDRTISAGHLLIGLIDQGDNAALRLLAAADIGPDSLRADTLSRMRAAA